MKKFIQKSLTFILILLIYFGLNSLINYFIYSDQQIQLKNKKILIAGDSHPQNSINPKLFKSAQNIAQSAEPYVLTYWKLKNIFKSHIPDTLILGLSPHNISEFNDLKFSNKHWTSRMFSRSYTIQEFNDLENQLQIDYTAYYKTLWKHTSFYPKENHINFIGKYNASTLNNLSNCELIIKRHFYINDEECGISQVSLNYLDSIVTLCKNKNIMLVLASPPVHKDYYENIPLTILNGFLKVKDKYNDEAIIIDKTKSNYADSLFLDSDHLNVYGALRFTSELIKQLNEIRANQGRIPQN